MSGAVFTLGNSVSGSLGLGDAISKLGRVAVTGLTIEQDPDTVNSYLTTRYAGLSAVTSGGVTTFLNPSLVVIPSAYNNGIVYSLHSKQVNTGNFTVTRNTEARRVNSAGQIASIGSGLPRLDYLTSGGTVGTPALLVEPAGTNLCLQSTDTTTSWTLGANLTSGAIDVIGVSGINLTVAVSGSSIGDTPGANRMATINATLTSGSTYTISFLMKKTGAHTIGGFFANTSGATATAFGSGFDVSGSFSSGSLIATSPITNRIRRVERFGSDVFRCSETFTMTETNVLTVLRLGPTVSVTSLNNSAVGTTMGFAAPQIELSSVPTSFIPTAAASGSRSADVISVSGAVSGSIGQTEGTIYWEGAIYRFDRVFFALSSGTSTAQAVRLQTTGAGLLQGIAIVNGSVQGNPQTSGAVTLGQFYKVAFAYKENDFVLYVNGVLQASDPSGTLPTNLNSVYFCNSNGTEITDQRCRAAALYTTRLTNQQLQLLTTL
jgi:hypothetical protein